MCRSPQKQCLASIQCDLFVHQQSMERAGALPALAVPQQPPSVAASRQVHSAICQWVMSPTFCRLVRVLCLLSVTVLQRFSRTDCTQ